MSEASGWTTTPEGWRVPWEIGQQWERVKWIARTTNGGTDAGMLEAIIGETLPTWEAEHIRNLSHRQSWELEVLERAGWRCERCGAPRNLQCHHKIYRSQGGRDDVSNGEVLCERCHSQEHHPGSA